ncbi:hypothetical protein U0070_022964 [Myodes glareolus]|uniref:Uncharacterized protein n=1 Tax=Myodes glareolus TaxID=447135 RepID=A0AAW0I967_MYOGA
MGQSGFPALWEAPAPSPSLQVQEGERPNRLDPQNPAYAEETGPSVIVNGFSERPRASHSQRIRPNSENLARSRPRSVPVRLALVNSHQIRSLVSVGLRTNGTAENQAPGGVRVGFPQIPCGTGPTVGNRRNLGSSWLQGLTSPPQDFRTLRSGSKEKPLEDSASGAGVHPHKALGRSHSLAQRPRAVAQVTEGRWQRRGAGLPASDATGLGYKRGRLRRAGRNFPERSVGGGGAASARTALCYAPLSALRHRPAHR